jgi:hypothetical protein
MIDTAELGRKMMAYSKNIDNDAEFNDWCRLAPKLIGLGAATFPKTLNELTINERALVGRALTLLVDKGELVLQK